MKYPKINTLFQRKYTLEECKAKKIKKNPIQIPTVSKIEFNFIKSWVIKSGEIRGRTDQASIPPKLLRYLRELFTPEKMQEVFGDKDAILYLKA